MPPPAVAASATISVDRMLPGLHGLRGMAALAVVLFHLTHLAGIAVPPALTFIAADFGHGVQLFFALSAFALAHSTETTMGRAKWMVEYFVKRFWRIAPLYYFVLAWMVLEPWVLHGVRQFDVLRIVLNLTFAFGLAPWTCIVMAGWTVGVEALFYVVFPVLLVTVRRTSSALWLVVVAGVVSQASRVALDQHFANTTSLYGYNWGYFSFAPNLVFFAAGLLAFRLAHDPTPAAKVVRRFLPAASIALLAVLLLTELEAPLKGLGSSDLLLWGAAFAGLCVSQGTNPGRWSANRVFGYLGERSYSLYLLHPIVILRLKEPLRAAYAWLTPLLGPQAFFVCALLLLLPLLAATEAAYRLIEVPGIRWGRKVNRRLRTPVTAEDGGAPMVPTVPAAAGLPPAG